MENKVIRVLGQNHQTFLSKLEDMNKRLAKRNLPLINAELKEEYDTKTKEQIPVPYEPFAVQIDVTYHYFVYELSSGFDQKNIAGVDVQFEGVVDLIEKNENAKVFKLADTNLFKYLKDCQCDECHKSIGRNKYLVFSKVGKPVESRDDLVVLGTSCAKNYFPFDVVNYIGNTEAFYEELFDECDDSMGFGFHNSNYINIKRLFHYVGIVTEDFRIYEKDNGTRTKVELLIKGKRERDAVYYEPRIKWEDMVDWLTEAYGNWDNLRGEFEINVHGVMFEPQYKEGDPVTIRQDINMKYLGIACYAFVGAKKAHDEKLAEEARRKAYLDSINDSYFGEIGAKFEKELVFEKSFAYQNDFGYYGGTTYILLFRDDEGHVFKWSTSNGCYKSWSSISGNDGYCDYEIGKKYLIKGSIKDHAEYKGVKQTVITRCKVLKDSYESHVFSKKEIEKILADKEVEKVSEPYEDPLEIFQTA